MKKKDRLYFKKILLEEKERLLNNVKSLLQDSSRLPDDLCDEADLASIELSRSVAFDLRAKERETILEIGYALEKLESGEYGFCEECGESIALKRLKLFPMARLCIQHQEEVERKKKNFAA